jgi:hypothetical protein
MSFFGTSKRARRGDPHGWTSFQNYITVHESHLNRFRDYFIDADDLQYTFPSPDRFVIHGRIRCRHALFIDIDKTLAFNDRQRVRTLYYSYHAGVEGPEDRPIFRYDNAHRYAREGHADEHHKHRFDPATWQEIEPPTWVGYHGWPHLSDVIEELLAWWDSIGQHLALGP